MKTKITIKLTEKILLLISLLSVIGMLLVIPGSSAIAYFFLYLLAMFYAFLTLPLFLGVEYDSLLKKDSYVEMTNTTAVVVLLTGWTLTVIILGIVFKMIHLHAGGVIWAGIVLSAGVFYLASKNKLKRKLKKEIYKKVVRYLFIASLVGFIVAITPKKTLIKIYSHNDPQVMRLYEKMKKDKSNPQVEAQFYEALRNAAKK